MRTIVVQGRTNETLRYTLADNIANGVWNLSLVSISVKCEEDINTHVAITTNLINQEERVRGSSATTLTATTLAIVLLKGRRGYRNVIGLKQPQFFQVNTCQPTLEVTLKPVFPEDTIPGTIFIKISLYIKSHLSKSRTKFLYIE